jgi:hypothetical protein
MQDWLYERNIEVPVKCIQVWRPTPSTASVLNIAVCRMRAAGALPTHSGVGDEGEACLLDV